MQKPCTHSQEKSSVSSIRQSVESRHGTVVSVPVFVFLSAPSPHVPDIEIGQSVVSHSPHSLPSPQRSYSPVVIYPKNAVSPVDSFPSGRFPQLSASPVVSVGQFPQRSVSPLVSSPVVSVGRCQSVGVSRSVSVGVGRCRSVSPVVSVEQFPQWSVSPVDGFPSGQCRSVVSFPSGQCRSVVSFLSGQFPQWSVSVSGQFPQWSVFPRGLCCWSVSRAVRFPSGRNPPQLKQARP